MTEYKIVFKKDTHEYFVNDVKKICISDVVQGLQLADFGAVPKHYLIEGRERGKEVHAICESWDKGILVIESVDDRLMGYTKAWLSYLKDYRPEWLWIEKIAYSPIIDVCGTVDRVGVISKVKTLVDIKTSEMILPSTTLQTAVYQKMYECMTGEKIKSRLIVHLSEGGKYKIEEHKDNTDINYAMASIMTYKWKVANKQDKDIQYNKELYNF